MNLYKIMVFWQFKCPFLHENTVFAPKPSSNLKINYWRCQKMWNLKIEFGTIFWNILTLHPHNSKSSLPTTGAFRYVETHILYLFDSKIIQAILQDLFIIILYAMHGTYYCMSEWFILMWHISHILTDTFQHHCILSLHDDCIFRICRFLFYLS